MAKNKKKELDPIKAIKKMEKKKRAVVVSDEKVRFDIWWAQRCKFIPKCHTKEIVKANFKAWGLGKEATFKEFDKALKKYGVVF